MPFNGQRSAFFCYFCRSFFSMKNWYLFLVLAVVLQLVMGASAQNASSCEGTPTVTDHQGNIYKTIQLGKQCWMAENMRCTTSPSNKRWYHNPLFTLETPVFQSYYITPRNSSHYGLLYNWSAAMDLGINEYAFYSGASHRRGICPKGWHLPSNDEWSLLLQTLGGTRKAGSVMKSSSSTWITPVIADKLSGFDAQPAGIYTENGLEHTGNYAYYWSATTYDRQNAWSCGLFSYNSDSYNILDYKCYGRSVRCVKD